MERNDLAEQLSACATLHGEFLLRSGVVSTVYFDKYRFEADPKLLLAISQHLKAFVPADSDWLAGLEMGGIPIGVMLSQQTGISSLLVRKEAKTYGTCKLAEGGDFAGKKLCIVEDVVTSGGQVIESTKLLREQGAIVDTVVCVIDREAGGREKLAAIGLELRALFTRSELEAFGN